MKIKPFDSIQCFENKRGRIEKVKVKDEPTEPTTGARSHSHKLDSNMTPMVKLDRVYTYSIYTQTHNRSYNLRKKPSTKSRIFFNAAA